MSSGAPQRCAPAVALIVAAILLAGCSPSSGPAADASGVTGGYVAGDGSIVVLAETDRVTAPELSATTFDGEPFSLTDQRGRVVVLNVWASWCAPCRAEAPDLVSVASELAGRGVQFVGLNIRDSDTTARAFVETFSVPYPNIADQDGRMQLLFSESLPPSAIPSTLVIDTEGRVAARALGRVSASTLRGMIMPLLPPAVPSP